MSPCDRERFFLAPFMLLSYLSRVRGNTEKIVKTSAVGGQSRGFDLQKYFPLPILYNVINGGFDMKRMLIISFLLLLTAPVHAVSGISFGVKGGMALNYDQAGLSIGDFSAKKMNLAGAQVRITTIPMIDLILSGDYAWKNNSYNFAGQNFDLKMHDLSFNATLVHPFKFPAVSPYVGGGIGSHHLSFDYVSPLSMSLSENGITIPGTETRTGYHLVGGVNIGIPAFPLGFGVEYRLNWIDTPGSVTKYNSLTFGINFSLP